MKELSKFVKQYGYLLNSKLVYNSYRDGSRNYVRDYDSVSVTEILKLIEDVNLKFLKNYYQYEMEEAMKYGTSKHKDLEIYFKKKIIDKDDNININFKKALIENNIEIKKSEVTYKKQYKSLPTITGDIDNISEVNGEEYIIDYKISKNRNFKTKKYYLQMAGYRWLSGIKNSSILYLNNKDYKFSVTENNELYDKIWLELLDYANTLFEYNKIENLGEKQI